LQLNKENFTKIFPRFVEKAGKYSPNRYLNQIISVLYIVFVLKKPHKRYADERNATQGTMPDLPMPAT
jgi:hypothetical protein